MKFQTRSGFAIVSALFILVVLSALGAGILNITSSQQIGAAQDLQGVKAYQAARAGLEWGMYQVQSTPAYNFGYASSDPNLRSCATASGDLDIFGFRVTVDCSTRTDATGGPTIYRLTSTACLSASASCPIVTGAGTLYVERRLSLVF